MSFFEQVKPLWDKSELTLAHLAEICNISESSASRYLNGKVNPPADVAEKILILLGGPAPVNGGDDMQTVVREIREIYEAEISLLRADHAEQISALNKDKKYLAIFAVVLFAVIIYLFIDGLHGGWGLFQYPLR